MISKFLIVCYTFVVFYISVLCLLEFNYCNQASNTWLHYLQKSLASSSNLLLISPGSFTCTLFHSCCDFSKVRSLCSFPASSIFTAMCNSYSSSKSVIKINYLLEKLVRTEKYSPLSTFQSSTCICPSAL